MLRERTGQKGLQMGATESWGTRERQSMHVILEPFVALRSLRCRWGKIFRIWEDLEVESSSCPSRSLEFGSQHLSWDVSAERGTEGCVDEEVGESISLCSWEVSVAFLLPIPPTICICCLFISLVMLRLEPQASYARRVFFHEAG